MSCYGGPIETPNIDRIVERVCATQFRDGSVLADSLVSPRGPQPHQEQHGLHHRGGDRLPEPSGTIPPENGMLSEILGERGWNTYMVGKWHLSDRRDEPGRSPAQLADRPWIRAVVRLPRRRDESVVSIWSTTTPGRPPRTPEEVTTDRDITDKALEFIQDSKRLLGSHSSLYARAPAPPRRRTGSRSSRAGSTWATGVREETARTRRSSASSPRTQLPPINPIRTRRAKARDKPFPSSTTPGQDSLNEDEKRLFCRMAEVCAGFGHADHIGRLLDYLEESGELEKR